MAGVISSPSSVLGQYPDAVLLDWFDEDGYHDAVTASGGGFPWLGLWELYEVPSLDALDGTRAMLLRRVDREPSPLGPDFHLVVGQPGTARAGRLWPYGDGPRLIEDHPVVARWVEAVATRGPTPLSMVRPR